MSNSEEESKADEPIKRIVYDVNTDNHTGLYGFGYLAINFDANTPYKDCLIKAVPPEKNIQKRKKQIIVKIKEFVMAELGSIVIPENNILLVNLKKKLFNKIRNKLHELYPDLLSIISDYSCIKYVINYVVQSNIIDNESDPDIDINIEDLVSNRRMGLIMSDEEESYEESYNSSEQYFMDVVDDYVEDINKKEETVLEFADIDNIEDNSIVQIQLPSKKRKKSDSNKSPKKKKRKYHNPNKPLKRKSKNQVTEIDNSAFFNTNDSD